MGKINVLDKSIAELIAAGEVVERPASVIKELLENSIDAGADAITVEIKNGGVRYIRITDNGSGILSEDVPKAFLRHATSKVSAASDLDSISTLGFRGEALASVCAVAKVQMLTKHESENTGTLYEISASEQLKYEAAGCPKGTTIIVRDLFYNVPARMKFLKKDVAEGNAIANILDKLALSHSEIAFTFIRDGKKVLQTSGDGNLKSAIYSVYGREFVSKLIPIEYVLDGVEIRGYITKPEYGRPNRNMQNFFINGRFVKSVTAAKALEEAFKGSIMVGKMPSCVMHIKIPFESIDVNVHPAKVEVRFINERPIFDAVYHGTKTALLKGDEAKKISLNNADIIPHKTQQPFSFESSPYAVKQEKPVQPALKISQTESFSDKNVKAEENEEPEIFIPKTKQFVQSAYGNSEKYESNLKDEEIINKSNAKNESITLKNIPDNVEIKEKVKEENFIANIKQASNDETEIRCENICDDFEEEQLKYLGEAFSAYIIVQKGNDKIMFIDKHAAHERIIYERLLKEKGRGYMQILLTPVIVSLPKNEYGAVIENIDKLNEYNFEIDDFGNGKIAVRGIPQYVEHYGIEDMIAEIADNLIAKKNDINTEQMDWIFHSAACRAAIKAGDVNYEQELMEIARTVDTDENIRYCPHGRPVRFILTKRELEKQFGRV